MTDPSPFSQAAIRDAIQQTLGTQVLPPGKTHAIILMPTFVGGPGVKAIYAQKIGDHWQFSTEAEWHSGGEPVAGATLAASW